MARVIHAVDSLVQTENHGREPLTNAGGGVEVPYDPEVMLPEAGNLQPGIGVIGEKGFLTCSAGDADA